jgi:hypothetical protein
MLGYQHLLALPLNFQITIQTIFRFAIRPRLDGTVEA